MSSNKTRSQAQRARAHRFLQQNEADLIKRIDRNGKINKLTPERNVSKKPLGESKQLTPTENPVKENPYARLLRRLREDDAARNKKQQP
ncbi:MAG: hypothetical protein WBX22_01590 [Silvibacterium sp.]